MKPYRAKPHCSLCGSVRKGHDIAQHNLACANYGERSYNAGRSLYDRPLTTREVLASFRTPSMQFKPFYGRRVHIPGAA